MPRDAKCQMCGTEMIYHKYEFLRCPDCGSEFWPFVGQGSVKETIREEFEKDLPCDRNTEVSAGVIHVKAKTAGSKSGKVKNDNKQRLAKPTTTELYKKLTSK